jgi:hypothetical protein
MTWLHAVIDVPERVLESEGRFWSSALGWHVGPPWTGHPELRSFEPPEGDSYLHLQRIDDGPRLHLDLDSDDPASTVDHAVRLGAGIVRDADEWTTLHSPGGLPFCVVRARHRIVPQPVTWPGGQRSRLVQVCVDSPRARHPDEVTFWRALLGGRWVDSHAPEFAGKWHDDAGGPVQLLFQVVHDDRRVVTAHIDLGADDVPVESQRLRREGAVDVGPGRGWHVLMDPAGLVFCVTGNDPGVSRTRDLG